MAHYSDLSFYEYCQGNPPMKNVGWLQRGNAFETAPPSGETLDLLWSFCKVSVMPARGVHGCDLCAPHSPVAAIRDGVRLLLGAAEIRVFSKEGVSLLQQRLRDKESPGLLFLRKSAVPFDVYSAPNLVYHYVHAHCYKPPDEFLTALREGPRPQDQKYFQSLEKLELEWRLTPSESPTVFKR
jgi:hypothetical protein